jgi:hypothetical protein
MVKQNKGVLFFSHPDNYQKSEKLADLFFSRSTSLYLANILSGVLVQSQCFFKRAFAAENQF